MNETLIFINVDAHADDDDDDSHDKLNDDAIGCFNQLYISSSLITFSVHFAVGFFFSIPSINLTLFCIRLHEIESPANLFPLFHKSKLHFNLLTLFENNAMQS